MAKSDKRRVVLKQSTYFQYSNRIKRFPGCDLLIFDNGDMAFSVLKRLSFKHKIGLEVANNDIAKVETSASSGEVSSMSIKITDTDGNIDVLDVVVIGFKNKVGEVMAKIPAILSSLYGDRYSKL